MSLSGKEHQLKRALRAGCSFCLVIPVCSRVVSQSFKICLLLGLQVSPVTGIGDSLHTFSCSLWEAACLQGSWGFSGE